MGTALVYHEDMTVPRLLWDDPECEIECPERLTTALESLRQRGLEQRCLRLVAREASEEELGLVHSPEYVALLRGTQSLDTDALRELSAQYDAVYFHPSTFHCARLAAGAALQLVDAVLTGAVHNGLALVRPPGHHSQRAAASGFCVFNNVAVAAQYAKQNLPAPLALDAAAVRQEEAAPWGELQAWARPHAALTQAEALAALGKALRLLDGIQARQVSSGLAAVPAPAVAASLDVALQRCLSQGAQRLLCVAVGQLDPPPALADDGRTLYLNIRGEEVAAPSMFRVSMPLPRTTGGFLSCVLALVLPLAYGFQPDLALVVLGPAHGLQDPRAVLLAALLQAPAGGRVLVLVEEESTPQLTGALAQALLGEPPPSLGAFSPASPEDMRALLYLRGQLGPRWELLQLAAPQ
ncbi:PREDICTED: histone deacetylase 10 [Condylura cristata]|uniref:histone deacetylase 10 n=1 Tax=Condylura cristata TaxID=143302 RepID=UPI000643DCCB|nr:PREDICTED: histone deacetylase 10 [Condylura cristata]